MSTGKPEQEYLDPRNDPLYGLHDQYRWTDGEPTNETIHKLVYGISGFATIAGMAAAGVVIKKEPRCPLKGGSIYASRETRDLIAQWAEENRPKLTFVDYWRALVDRIREWRQKGKK